MRYIAAGRTEAWNEMAYDTGELIIISGNHRYAELYARHVHKIAHRGVNADIAKIRTEYWIICIRKLVHHIRHNCVRCRRYEGKLEEQIMAPLPIERLRPAPVWYNTGIDLFGPFPIKGDVNKRSVGKGYGILPTY